MTAIASGDIPEEWGIGDQVHLELYTRLSNIADLGEFNAIIYFANQLILDHVDKKRAIDDDDLIALDKFLDHALLTNRIVKQYLGDNYVTDYIETLEDNDD